MTPADLLRCPFCGDDKPQTKFLRVPSTWDELSKHIFCMTCGIETVHRGTFEQAAAKWNRRADLASVRDAAYEKAAQTCEARIMPQPDDIDCQEANWNSEAQGCANFIRALKTAPKGK